MFGFSLYQMCVGTPMSRAYKYKYVSYILHNTHQTSLTGVGFYSLRAFRFALLIANSAPFAD